MTFLDDIVPAEPGKQRAGVRPVLHMRLFHPVDDHTGFSPIEAANVAIDVHK